MFRRLFGGALIFTSLPMLYGCGTVRNFEGQTEAPGRLECDLGGLIGPPGGRQIYGGACFDLVGIESLVSISSFPAGNIIGAYLIAVDLPLSFIADTLTLPWTIKATISRDNSKHGAELGQAETTSSTAPRAKTP